MTLQAQTNEQLLKACAGKPDAKSWEEFVRRFQPLIASVIIRVAQKWGQESSGLVDDLVQETFLKLCRNDGKALREFQAEHDAAIFGFIKTVALNVAIDHFRATRPQNTTELDDEIVATTAANNDSSVASHSETVVLLNQIDAALRRHSAGANRERDRVVFWLYYRHGFTARAIASLPSLDLTVKGVETVIFRLTKAIREDLGATPGPPRRAG